MKDLINFLGGYDSLKKLHETNASSIYLPDLNKRIVLSNYDIPEILRNYRIEHNLFDVTDIVVDLAVNRKHPFVIDFINNEFAVGYERNGKHRKQMIDHIRHATVEERVKNKVLLNNKG